MCARFHTAIETGRGDGAFDDDVAGGFGMHQRRAVGQGLAAVGQRGGFGDVDLDLIAKILRLILARGKHRRDRFAGEANHAVGEDRLSDRDIVELVQHRPDRLYRLEIG